MKPFISIVVLTSGLALTGAAPVPSDDRMIVHVLNRVAFGPRAGDIDRVKVIGLQRYIDEQLHPERIPDAAMSARLSGLTTLGMSSREIAETYEIPQLQARREKKQETPLAPARIARGRGAFGRMPMPPAPRPNPQGKKAPKGLNENYGRELMELHTLGVDGGYTQKDVTEVARAFTGWTIQNPRLGGGFRFEPRIHDTGEKIVLGHVIKSGAEGDGEQVLDILAKHPSAARFIATKLVRRFVSDTPPPSLVDRAAARFRETDGDLREEMRTILTSPEFLSPEVYRAQVKTPFEIVASALRATGADVQDATLLVRTMQQLGMPLYMCQPPTGYKDTADAWVNTGALVNRMNFSLTLAGNKLPGVAVDSLQSQGDGQTFARTVLGDDVSE